MADVDTAIAMPARRGSTRLTRQGTFFDVTMSKKRLDRVVPIIAIHETAPPAQDPQIEHIQPAFQDAPVQACKAVLATPELLENILVSLPARNIFGATRVSRTFRNCVATSPAIQEKLFFRPTGLPKEVWQVLGPQVSWYFAIRKRYYLKPRDLSECDPESECLVTPVVLNPCAEIINTSSNYHLKINLPKIHYLGERGECPRVPNLLHANGSGIGISFMDTLISQPTCERIDVRFHIALVDHAGTIQAEFTIRQQLPGQDASTPRAALKACWESSRMLRLWRRGECNDGGEFSCHLVKAVKVSELVEKLEEEEKLTAVIGDGTTFMLCNAIAPSEATRDAVEVGSSER